MVCGSWRIHVREFSVDIIQWLNVDDNTNYSLNDHRCPGNFRFIVFSFISIKSYAKPQNDHVLFLSKTDLQHWKRQQFKHVISSIGLKLKLNMFDYRSKFSIFLRLNWFLFCRQINVRHSRFKTGNLQRHRKKKLSRNAKKKNRIFQSSFSHLSNHCCRWTTV